MNWILLSPPPLSFDRDTPQNLERAQGGGGAQVSESSALHYTLYKLYSVHSLHIWSSHTIDCQPMGGGGGKGGETPSLLEWGWEFTYLGSEIRAKGDYLKSEISKSKLRLFGLLYLEPENFG